MGWLESFAPSDILFGSEFDLTLDATHNAVSHALPAVDLVSCAMDCSTTKSRVVSERYPCQVEPVLGPNRFAQMLTLEAYLDCPATCVIGLRKISFVLTLLWLFSMSCTPKVMEQLERIHAIVCIGLTQLRNSCRGIQTGSHGILTLVACLPAAGNINVSFITRRHAFTSRFDLWTCA